MTGLLVTSLHATNLHKYSICKCGGPIATCTSGSGDSVSMSELAGKQVSQLVQNPYTGKLNHVEQIGSGVYTSCAACDSLCWFMYG